MSKPRNCEAGSSQAPRSSRDGTACRTPNRAPWLSLADRNRLPPANQPEPQEEHDTNGQNTHDLPQVPQTADAPALELQRIPAHMRHLVVTTRKPYNRSGQNIQPFKLAMLLTPAEQGMPSKFPARLPDSAASFMTESSEVSRSAPWHRRTRRRPAE